MGVPGLVDKGPREGGSEGNKPEPSARESQRCFGQKRLGGLGCRGSWRPATMQTDHCLQGVARVLVQQHGTGGFRRVCGGGGACYQRLFGRGKHCAEDAGCRSACTCHRAPGIPGDQPVAARPKAVSAAGTPIAEIPATPRPATKLREPRQAIAGGGCRVVRPYPIRRRCAETAVGVSSPVVTHRKPLIKAVNDSFHHVPSFFIPPHWRQ